MQHLQVTHFLRFTVHMVGLQSNFVLLVEKGHILHRCKSIQQLVLFLSQSGLCVSLEQFAPLLLSAGVLHAVTVDEQSQVDSYTATRPNEQSKSQLINKSNRNNFLLAL